MESVITRCVGVGEFDHPATERISKDSMLKSLVKRNEIFSRLWCQCATRFFSPLQKTSEFKLKTVSPIWLICRRLFSACSFIFVQVVEGMTEGVTS